MSSSRAGMGGSAGERIRSMLAKERDFLLLLALFVAFRLMAVLFFRPGGYIRDWSDYTTYLGIAGLSDEGLYPSIHFWLEYPPLFPWLFAGLYRLSLWIPVWSEDPRLWFNTLLGLTLLAFETGSFILLYICGKRTRGRESGLRIAAVYALLFVPLYVLLGYYDTIPAFFMLLGMFWLLRERGASSGVALGIGFALKLTPIVLSAVAVRVLAGFRRRIWHVLAAGLSIALLSLPFLLANPRFYLTSFRSAAGRSSWETPWALLEGYYSYGVVAGDRFDPTVVDFSNHASTLPWLAISVIFAAFALWVYTRRVDYGDSSKVLALATATMTLFILYSKGYSPQFLIYLLPLVLLCLEPTRAVAYAVVLSLLNLLEHPVYFVLLPEEHWLLLGIVAWRTALLVAVLVDALGVLAILPEAVRRMRAHLATVLVAGWAVWFVVAGIGMGRAYFDGRYRAEEYRPVIDFLKENDGQPVLFTDPEPYRRLYPYLHSEVGLRMATTGRPTWPADIRAWAERERSFWLWRGDQTDPDLEDWLRTNTEAVSSHKFDQGELFLLSVKEEQSP